MLDGVKYISTEKSVYGLKGLKMPLTSMGNRLTMEFFGIGFLKLFFFGSRVQINILRFMIHFSRFAIYMYKKVADHKVAKYRDYEYQVMNIASWHI